jgi:hypothetical protein
MAYAAHLPQVPSKIAALGVAAALAWAAATIGISEMTDNNDAAAPAPHSVVAPESAASPELGPASTSYPKWGAVSSRPKGCP